MLVVSAQFYSADRQWANMVGICANICWLAFFHFDPLFTIYHVDGS